MSRARIRGLAPVAAGPVRTLILGSMPSVASLELQQYYGHPRNAFWDVVDAIGIERSMPYAERCRVLCARGFGLWDVLAECEREGSLDQAIRAPRPNDIARFARRHPELRALWFNGQASRRLFDRHLAARVGATPGGEALELRTMPSTSPAHTARSKLATWRRALRTAARRHDRCAKDEG